MQATNKRDAIIKLNVLNQKTEHSNLQHILERGAAEGEMCSYVDKLIISVKLNLKHGEEATKKLSKPFPEHHLQEHQKLSKQIDELAENINNYEKKDFINIIKTLYLSHHYGYDLQLYDYLSSSIA